MVEAEIKQQLVKACEDFVEERIGRIQLAIKDLEDALKLETKCSMGDKYETGRAMLHLEFEKLSAQHAEYQKLRKTLRLVHPKKIEKIVTFGCVVKTSQFNYFIAIPAGEIVVASEKYYAIGANAPIARLLIGKKEQEKVTLNNHELLIAQVF